MKKTRQFFSVLLTLAMLLSLLPTTALAADTYPTASEVCVDGSKYFASGHHYFRNGETACSNDPTNYNAYYNPSTGTLTLDGYNGGSITVGGTSSKITVVLKGTNTITNGSLTSAWGGDITVTSSSGDTLLITNTLNGSNAAIGIETGYGPQTTGNVTITGDAKVTINMTNNGTSTYEKAYGIFARENITISESASVDITCATPNNTTGGSNCNGLYAAQNVIINTGGTIKIDVKNAGKDDGYSFGIYPMGNATLTKVGNMEVQWKSHATHTSYPGGVIKGGGSFDTNTHAVNEDTTNCYASYRSGTPYTVTVVNGDLTGPGVPKKMGSGMFLVGDTVNITPYEMKGKSGEKIPFKEWTAEGVALTSSTTADTSFNVPANAVTVTATHSPFVVAPMFKRTDDSKGTIAFQTAVKPDDGTEYFEYVKVGKENDPYEYRSIAPQPTTASTASPYEYRVSASSYYTGGDIKNLEAGDYRMAVTLNGKRYLSDPFTVNYTAAPTPTATVDDVTIDGTTGTAIADKEVIITLANDTFASTLSGSWITNLPAGLSQSVSRTDDTHAKITVSGNPSAVSSDALIIKIPAASLTSGSDLDVTGNANAKYNIKASVAALGGSAGITGTAKYNEILTADTSAITGNTGTFLYQWKRNGTDIPGAVNSTYKIVTEDIGKTITVAISSSVESGTIVSPATATVGKADTPSAPTGLSGLTGQPLSTVTLPSGWTWVDGTTVMNTAGTQTFKANYTDTTGNYENETNVDVTVEVIDKTNVSASITFADGKLTYNGAGQAYETASISGITAGANPGWTYAYVPSGTGSLDASGKPQNAGTYTVTATYEDDDNYGTKSAVLEIKKAVPTGTPKYTEITTAGKTLADAAITTTGADFSVPGAVIWVSDDGVTPLPDTTVVAANTYYKWLFTPTDTDNYETLTGTIRLYRRSSGGGGGGRSTSRYTVSFESNGGSKVSNQTVTRNSVMKEPTAPTKENFDFDGWYSDKELKTKYDFSAKVTKSFTLYAKWTEKDNSVNQIILTIGKKDAQVFGKAKSNDVAPKIVNDRTMLPARFVAESLGAKVEWDGEKELVTITGKNEKDEDVTILITIGAPTAKVNGKEIKLDSPAFIENDRTYTPVRFISEYLGASVEWDEKDQKVIITKPEIKKAETK